MSSRISPPLYAALALLLLSACSTGTQQGPWLNQPLPDDHPRLFAPGIVSSGADDRDLAVSPGGDEIYFSRSVAAGSWAVMVCRFRQGRWLPPEVAPFSRSPKVQDIEPCLSPDGSRMYFVSDRRDPQGGAGKGNFDIWVMDREGDGWGTPRNPGPPLNTPAGEFFPSVTATGTIYFCRNDPRSGRHFIYRSRPQGQGFDEPEKLAGPVNGSPSQFNACVSADESCLIVSIAGRKDSRGGCDYYACFPTESGDWSEPYPLPGGINSASGREWSPYLSRGGEYFFFMSARGRAHARFQSGKLTRRELNAYAGEPENGSSDIYWVRADFLDRLRFSGVKKKRSEGDEKP